MPSLLSWASSLCGRHMDNSQLTEFEKTKIALAVALLAILFTLQPLLQQHGPFLIFPWTGLTLNHAYYLSFGSLALCVFCYGFEFVLVASRVLWIHRVGNVLYVFAFLVPVVAVLLVLVVLLVSALSVLAQLADEQRMELLKVLSNAASVTLLVLTFLVVVRSRKRLERAESQSANEEAQSRERIFTLRADQLFDAGYYDMAVLDLYRAIESAIVGALERSGVRTGRMSGGSLLDLARNHEILDEVDLQTIKSIRQLRNQAVHSEIPVSEEAAVTTLDQGTALLRRLRGVGADEPQD